MDNKKLMHLRDFLYRLSPRARAEDDRREETQVIQGLIKCYINVVIQQILEEGHKVLAMEPFPWEWVRSVSGVLIQDENAENLVGNTGLYRKWLTKVLGIFEEEAKKHCKHLIPRNKTMIDYEALFSEHMIASIRKALSYIKDDRMPEPHSFYISFLTDFEGVRISDNLRRLYPHDMLIVLQHQFWDLIVEEDRFSVVLTFSDRLEALSIPYGAILRFIDPGAEVEFTLVPTWRCGPSR